MTKTLLPRRPWFTFAAGGILAFLIVLLLAAVSGCGPLMETQTWPAVAGHGVSALYVLGWVAAVLFFLRGLPAFLREMLS